MGRHSLVRKPFTRRAAVGAAALTASAALTAGLAFGDGQAQAANPQVTSGLASIHDQTTALLNQIIAQLGIESTSALGGVSLDPAGEVRDFIEDGFDSLPSSVQAVLTALGVGVDDILEYYDSRLGNSTTIALLPGLAAGAALGGDNTTFALAILGLAAATAGVNDLENYLPQDVIDAINGVPVLGPPIITGIESLLPEDVIFCFGGLAVANSSTAGSCANIAATVDLRYDKPDGRVELALTNPLSALSVLTDTEQLGLILLAALTGEPIYLTQDFARLTLNGEGSGIALTSSYGYTGPVTIGWLGSQLVLFPGTFKAHGNPLGLGEDFVNYLSLPTFSFGTPSSALQLIPTFDVSSFNVLDLFTIPAFNTGNWLSGLGSSSPASATVSTLSLREAQPTLMTVSAEDDPSIDPDASADDSGAGGAGDGGSTGGGAAGGVETGTGIGGEADVDQAPDEVDTPAPVVVNDANDDDAIDPPNPAPQSETEDALSEEPVTVDDGSDDATDDEPPADETAADPASSPAVTPAA
ncbi:hypothetical protein ABLE92_13480 [Gordonia sp. VNQ95]|uniref:hypothetical protein n=1 Tax=Gordonia sp. VNQ95 TaxID=3156619 RepID=UPI0032B3A362